MTLLLAEDVQEDVVEFHADVDVAHAIIHGPASGAGSLVATDSGNVKTLARAIAEIALTTPFGSTISVRNEVGVINNAYPVGDVRRYGMFPNGHILPSLTITSGSGTISGPPGVFGATQVGDYFWSPQTSSSGSLITAITSTTITIDPVATGSVVGTGRAVAGGRGIIDNTTYNTIAANGKNPLIQLYFPPGYYASSFNMGEEFTGTEDNPWRAYFDHAAFGSVFHLTQGVSHIVAEGTVLIYDRFGVTDETPTYGFCADITFDTIILLSDVDKNIAFVGTGNSRGNHIGPIDGFYVKNMIVEDTYGTATVPGTTPADNTYANASTLAAFAWEQGPLAPSKGIFADFLWVKNSGTNAVALYGGPFNIKHIKVDGFGTSIPNYVTNGGVQGFSEQTAEIPTAFMARRWWGHIGRIELKQSNASSAATAQRLMLLSETGDLTGNDLEFKSATIDSINIEAGSPQGARGGNAVIGVTSAESAELRQHYDIGSIEIQLNETFLLTNSTDSLFTINPLTTGGGVESTINIDKMRFINPQGYNCFDLTGIISDSREVRVGPVEVLNFLDAGPIINMVGDVNGNTKVKMGPVFWEAGSAAYTTRHLINIQYMRGLDLEIDARQVAGATAVGNGVLRVRNCNDSEIKIRTAGYRGVNPVGVVSLDANVGMVIHDSRLVGDDTALSYGFMFEDGGTHNSFHFRNVRAQDFAVGTHKTGTPVFTLCSSINSHAISCAAASDLTAGGFAGLLNQNLVTP